MTWEPILSGLEGRRARLLEIGSYEGLSACFMLWRLPDASVTCVDTFAGSLDHHATRLDVRDLEARFDANIAPVDSNRVRKCVGD
ncbi:MAG: class I SAM-dependent methyltransferase [Actinomycetota bacterium]|nr:class I SAM-dependent methyltransferase [Actinomycetota bacterium]